MAGGGYAWWYLDALSDDGRHALVLIAFIGSVFSPYYARARARQGVLADALQHVAINVALYRTDGGAGARWAMTERSAAALQRSSHHLSIGPSALRWDGQALDVTLDERCTPWPRRLRGSLRLHPQALGAPAPLALDAAGAHLWWPIAPCSRIEVNLSEPGWQWQGSAYLDSNRGDGPLADSFSDWQWARASLAGQRSAVVYDATARGQPGPGRHIALQFGPHGGCQPFEAPPLQPLPPSRWQLARSQRSDPGHAPHLRQTLEDTPFYARSLVDAHWLGQPVLAVHESLHLGRFSQPIVQAMLPFRMPRRG